MNHNHYQSPNAARQPAGNQPNDNPWDNFQPDQYDREAALQNRANAVLLNNANSSHDVQDANYAERARQDRLRQKNKLMRAILHGSDVMDSSRPSSAPTELSPADQQRVYDVFNSHQINAAYESHFLQELMPPIGQHGEYAADVLDTLNTKHDRRILAKFSGRGFNNWENVNTDDLSAVLRAYPTPVEFQPVAADLLEQIRQQNSPQKASAYAKSIEDFQQKFYGKRYDYYQAFHELRSDALAAASAEQSTINQLKRSTTANSPHSAARSVDPNQIFGPVKDFGDEGGFMRQRLDSAPNQTPNQASNRTSASETPLDDSLHYMPPEVAARFGQSDEENNHDGNTQPLKSGIFGRFFGRKKS